MSSSKHASCIFWTFFPKGVKAPVAKNSRALPSRMLKALPCYYCTVIIIIIIYKLKHCNILSFCLFSFCPFCLFVWHHSDQMYEWRVSIQKSIIVFKKWKSLQRKTTYMILLFGIRSRWARVSKHNKLIFW